MEIRGAAFEALLRRASGDPVLVLVDSRLRVVRAGPQAAGLAGRPAEVLPGLSLIAAFGSAPLEEVARAALSSGEPATGEAQLGDAVRRTFQVDAVPVPDGDLVVALFDVTALRRIERVRRDFIANISHELRTPITSIKLMAEALRDAPADDAGELRDFASRITGEVDFLAQLVDELLDLTMIESGEVRLEMAAVVDPLPDTVRVQVQADRGRIGQALLNLAHNAVKYSHPGGEIRLGWEARPSSVRLTVADDGIGIGQAHQARIFERFYKVDRARTRQAPDEGLMSGSAGLGLAIVRHIAEAHGGSAGVDSTEGVGSTFWVEIPRKPGS